MGKCLNCFKDYGEGTICPFCGYKAGTEVQEPYYLVPGVVLQDRYMVGTSVGAGGFGVTYAAWDQVLNQKVAVKEYMPGEFSTRAPGETQITVYGGEKTEQFQQGKEKFNEESRRLAAFHNIPGIVQIFNTFHENGTVYIVMEFLEGETLEERLMREGKMLPDEALELMLMVLQALEAVHKEGILHRDIAPNNIFLTVDGGVKLLDFGASRSVTGTYSKSLTVLYKEGYTPEEQYRSRGEQGPWTDVYSCAATLYRMVSGEVPVGALERRMKDTLKPLSKMEAKVPRNVSTAVMNAMNVDVRKRTQSVGQFMAELTGTVKVRDHYERTIERRIGKIPLAVKIGMAVPFLAIVVFLIMLGTGIVKADASAFGSFMLPEGKTRVPNIVNCEIEEAQRKLENAGLKLLITDKQVSMQIPENRILSQEKTAGMVLDADTEIKVIVSAGVNSLTAKELEEKGIKAIEMPDLQYMDRDEALGILADAGVDFSVEYETTGIVEGGKVTRQSVDAGKKIMVDAGEPVVLTVEDFVIDWTGADEVEDIIRGAIDQGSGDVYASQLLEIKELRIDHYRARLGEEAYTSFQEEEGDYDPSKYKGKDQMEVSALKHCLNLTTLDIETWLFGDISQGIIIGLDELSNLIFLESIRMEYVTIDNLSWISNMKNLERLVILYGRIEQIGINKELDKLLILQMSGCDISTVDNDNLFRHIEELTIDQEGLMDIERILDRLKIKKLTIISEEVDKIIFYLAKIPVLSELYIYTYEGEEISIEKLAKETKVEQFFERYDIDNGDGTVSDGYMDRTQELNSYR